MFRVLLLLLLPIVSFAQDKIRMGDMDFVYPILSVTDSLNLDSLKERYFDLAPYKGREVVFKGRYKGDRIVFRNAQNVKITFKGKIESTHPEDAIAFLGDVNGLSISGSLKVNNAVTFWATMKDVDITGIRSVGAHTGIRATQDRPHSNVFIHFNKFVDTKHEGIYIGPSYLAAAISRNVRIVHNTFIRTGWDSAQVGNCSGCFIEKNMFIKAAVADELYQNWTITVNPGSLVYLRKNLFLGCPNRVQCLDSRCFEW
jgi:hypothetical protein